MFKQLHSILILAVFILSSSFATAGNGVERGRIINGTNVLLQPEIIKYLKSNVSACPQKKAENLFVISNIQTKLDRVDNGIVDTYYLLQMKQIADSGNLLGEVDIEILDSDFHNWKDYSERLSFKVINKNGNFCQ